MNGTNRIKAATTPQDQSIGVLDGVAQLATGEGLTAEQLLASTASVIHGTTTADNTMIEMSGAVTGLITTEGPRDEIELRRGFKEDIWDPAIAPPPPIAPRRRRIGVPERLDFEGAVVTPLNEQAQLEDAFTVDFIVSRALLRPGRGYEDAVDTFQPHDRIQEPNEGACDGLFQLATIARTRKKPAFLFVNSRLEGNAPGTIETVVQMILPDLE